MKKLYLASVSGGKDSVAMVDRLMAENRPLDYILFYDAGMEFNSIYKVIEKIKEKAIAKKIKFVTLKPQNDFLYDMLLRPVNAGTEKEHFGYDWCGGCCRWQTSFKVAEINKFLDSLRGEDVELIQYVGIAADEPTRLKYENGKTYPLNEWGMTEADALKWCYDHGYNWLEGDIDLYSILDRVSCWCCGNKNLKELKAIYQYLPEYWLKLKALQSRIDRPFRRNSGETIFDLEKRFEKEIAEEKAYQQLSLEDFFGQ